MINANYNETTGHVEGFDTGVNPFLAVEETELIYSVVPEYYKVLNKSLVVCTKAEKALIDAKFAKDSAYKAKMEELDVEKSKADIADFTYQNKVYLADKNSYQSIVLGSLVKAPTDTIETFPGSENSGKWITADGSFVPFTCTDFQEFAAAFFTRNVANQGAWFKHKSNIKALYKDSKKTAADIKNYKVNNGWA